MVSLIRESGCFLTIDALWRSQCVDGQIYLAGYFLCQEKQCDCHLEPVFYLLLVLAFSTRFLVLSSYTPLKLKDPYYMMLMFRYYLSIRS